MPSSNGQDVIELLTQLVAIDSVNPRLVSGAAGEREVAEFVAQWARAAGLSTNMAEETPGRPSVIVRGGQAEGGRALLLCGHLDTVGTGGMVDPLVPHVDGDRLYGRGAYDMKAGLAAALVACRDAVADGISGEVIVGAVADEEHSSIGIQQVLERVTADAAIVTEPTELMIGTAHKGFIWTEIEVLGKAAHGSRPHLGLDAILKTGPILIALDDLDQRLRGHQHPTLGPGSLHASLIAGGLEESTIPDRCVLTVERRSLPGERILDLEADIARLLAGCRTADPDLVVSARTTLAREPFEIGASEEIVDLLTDVTSRVLGASAVVGGMSYWADSAFISAAGIPTVLFGPGGDGAHAEIEWVSLSDTVTCTRVLTASATAFCQ